MVIRGPEDISPEWVEAALRRSGALLGGGVESVEVGPSRASTWAQLTPILVRYTPGSAGERPTALLLKCCHGVFGSSEVRYYDRDYVGLAGAPLVRCFDAAYEESPRRYHLLLADLGATHVNGDERAPSESHARALAEAFATLHAHRWGAARLAEVGEPLPRPADFERDAAGIASGLDRLLLETRATLEPAWEPRLRGIVARMAARHAARSLDADSLTLIHGDPNPGNLLVPASAPGPLLLIDRQPFDGSINSWPGAFDLVLAIVPWWDTAARRALEPLALQHYHRVLLERGVTTYPLDQLREDYRLVMSAALALPLRWCSDAASAERMRWLWTAQLERALAAWDDWQCGEVWE